MEVIYQIQLERGDRVLQKLEYRLSVASCPFTGPSDIASRHCSSGTLRFVASNFRRHEMRGKVILPL